MNRIEFTEDMNEVTGLGGFYERCCRAAIIAGAQWCMEHLQQLDLPSVERSMRMAYVTTDDGQKVPLESELTPAQFGLAMHHVRYVAKHGWLAYRKRMSEPLKVYDT